MMSFQSSAISENKVILLVEDNADDERVTLRALKKNNVMNEVVVAGDGEQAIEFLENIGVGQPLPSLIILDLHLPKLSGLEVLQKIRSSQLTAQVPVVMFSASEDPTAVRQSYEFGANSYIRKPEDLAEFSEVILQMSMYWLLLNRTPQTSILV